MKDHGEIAAIYFHKVKKIHVTKIEFANIEFIFTCRAGQLVSRSIFSSQIREINPDITAGMRRM